MIGRIWQRLIRETMIKIYREQRTAFAKQFPVYYFAFDGDLERVGLAVQALQEIPQIPWPDERCVILAEDVTLSLLTDDPQARGLVWMVYTKNLKALLGRAGTMELVYAGSTMLLGGKVVFRPAEIYVLEHVNQRDYFDDFIDPDVSKNRLLSQLIETCKKLGVHCTPERYSEYLDRVLVNDRDKECWIAFHHSVAKKPQPGLAADFLSYLANLAIPCHYMLKSRAKKGFGPTGEIRRLTKAKPIFSVIPHERLYKMLEGKGPEQEVSPHFRRGHIRHYWTKGIPPLNRFFLPDSPVERIKLVHRHKIPRRYIHPTWVGNPNLEDEGFDFEIMRGEMPLRPL